MAANQAKKGESKNMNIAKKGILFPLFLAGILLILIFCAKGRQNRLTVSKDPVKTTDVWQITYWMNGGTNSILNPRELTGDTPLPYPLQIPYKKGYNFSGWYEDETYEHKVEQLTELKDMTLYAKWTLNIDSFQNISLYPYESAGKRDVLLLKNLPFSLFYQIETPGNPKTRWEDFKNHYIDSDNQCPQGLCLTKDYVIISTYSAGDDKNTLGALIFYDRITGEHVKSFGMENASHLGGIAYDGKNLWICHSNTMEIERISYEFLEHLIRISKQNFIDISNCFSRYPVKNVPSCIAFDDGRLYVATHKVYTSSRMLTYTYNQEEDCLEMEKKYFIPSKVQGVTFDEEGRVYLSTSYGRTKSSYLHIYDSLEDLETFFNAPILSIEMPPGSEEIVRTKDDLYILFETACYKYYEGTDGNGTCDYPIDKIVILNLPGIFYD